jgi:hypothetical protein
VLGKAISFKTNPDLHLNKTVCGAPQLTASHGAMQANVQGFCKFKVASRTEIFILQKTKKHISLKKRFGRHSFKSNRCLARNLKKL